VSPWQAGGTAPCERALDVCVFVWAPCGQEFAARAADPLSYRYPGVGGESYMDLITNCRDVVLALERAQADVAVVCDVAVARVLLGYFEGIPISQIPNIEISPGIIELVRSHSGFKRSQMGVETGKPSLCAQPSRETS